MFVEFFGVPGCGKTSVALELIKTLNSKGINTMSYSSYYDTLARGFFWRLRLFLSTFDKETLKISSYLLKLFCSKKRKTIFDAKYTIFILMNYLVYRKIANEDNDSIICDEGLIQYIFSLYYDEKIKKIGYIKSILTCIQTQFPSLKYIHCEVDLRTNIYRITERKNGQSRLDCLSDDKMIAVINIQKLNSKLISGLLTYNFKLDVVTDLSPQKIAKDIYNKLYEKVD